MMDENEAAYLQQLEQAYIQEKQRNQQIQNKTSMFGGSQEDMIEKQLSLDKELERIDHVLRGHKLKKDEKGNLVYVESEDETAKPFNDKGVDMIMNVIMMYLNKNTLLSNYEKEEIHEVMQSFYMEITNLIHNKHDEMGMTTYEKKKLYPMVCVYLVDSVYSAYMRALNGEERLSLRKQMMVTQNADNMNPLQAPLVSPQKNKFSWWRPTTWGK